MGSQISNEASIPSSADISDQLANDPRSPSSNVARTPFRKILFLGDPRSPTITFARTPIRITKRISKSKVDSEALRINASESEIDQYQPEDFGENFDPRSPTTNFARTPIHITKPVNRIKANHQTIKFNISNNNEIDQDQQEQSYQQLGDPRSPTMNFARTPIHIARQTSRSNADGEATKFANITKEAIDGHQHEESCEIAPDYVTEMKLMDVSVSSEQPIPGDDQVEDLKPTEAQSNEEDINNITTSAISPAEDLVPALSTLNLETDVIDHQLNDTSKQTVFSPTECTEVLASLNNQQTPKNVGEKTKKRIVKKINNENIGVDNILKGKIVHQKLANISNVTRSPLKDSQNSPLLKSHIKNQRRIYGHSL